MERVLVWGAGGHGHVIADLVLELGLDLVGFADRQRDRASAAVATFGARIVAIEDDLRDRRGSGHGPLIEATRVALGIGDNAARLDCANFLGSMCAGPLVHPRAWLGRDVSIGTGTVVLSGAMISRGVRVGRAVIVNSSAVIEHDSDIADAAHVSPGAVLTGGTRVGTRAWIGANATVLPGVAIGSDVVVGAGAVVLRDVPDGLTVVGNPARPI